MLAPIVEVVEELLRHQAPGDQLLVSARVAREQVEREPVEDCVPVLVAVHDQLGHGGAVRLGDCSELAQRAHSTFSASLRRPCSRAWRQTYEWSCPTSAVVSYSASPTRTEEVGEERDARESCGREDVRCRLLERGRTTSGRSLPAGRQGHGRAALRRPRSSPPATRRFEEVGRLRREAPLKRGLQELADLVDELRGIPPPASRARPRSRVRAPRGCRSRAR